MCAQAAILFSVLAPGHPLSCVFDQGQQGMASLALTEKAKIEAAEWRVPITFSFAAVKDVTGLQAADMIATENYWYGLDYIRKGGEPAARPHLRHLVDNAETLTMMKDREMILTMREKFDRAE